ncbi:TonB-dependent receptor [Fibrisoma montanum]|uniref:TonB-dependent receptor n=1 Tax=Fibrisoma montanum TaxID=2305895 RepID=A0A418MAJ1_9BACT|nr:TonB-dependent receptor [Fibrisoma montanum]RIV23384.1 TonB-dependent receptor [Fibrisoma montanum]
MNVQLQTVFRHLFRRLLVVFVLQGIAMQGLFAGMVVGISGRVIDNEGQGLPGVNVVLKGSTNTGTTTDGNGQFRLDVPNQNAVLVFSSIGYVTQEVTVGSRTVLAVTMQTDTRSLNEVVVVGYGTQQRADVTGAIGSVGEKDFNRGVITSPEQLIQGKLSGVNITGNTGEPGANQTIIVRGPGSIRSGNTPLFVVDGVPLDNSVVSTGSANVGFGSSAPLNPLNFINPADIESVDVLKDASATAIYGSRGANGVVIITTKKGSAKKSGLSYSNYFGASTVANKIDLLSAEEFIRFQDANNRPANIYDRNISTDWQDQILRTAFTQNHNLALNGGSENSTYYVSLSLLNQAGIIKTNDLKRYTGRINFTQKLLDDRVGVSVNFTAGHTNNRAAPRNDFAGANAGSLIPDALGANPTYPVRNPDGSLFVFPQGRNPLADLELFDSYARTDRILGNIEGRLKLIKGLEYRINFAVDRSVGNGETQVKRSGLPKLDFPEGRAVFAKNESSSNLIENYLKYAFSFGSNTFDVLAGHSYQRFFQRSNSSSINNFSTSEIDAIYNPGIGTSLNISQNPLTGSASINELQSFYGRVNYAFADRYLLTATVRADGSSKFGANNRYGLFPSVSGAWKLKNEPFLSGLNFVSDLKLRAGWGQTGNQEIPGKITLPLLTSGTGNGQGYPLTESGITPGYTYSRTANPDIKWEVTTQTNVGLDFGLFGGALSGTVDYFYKNTSDMLLNITVSDPVSPTGSRWQNVAMNVINEGLELGLNYASPRSGKLYWQLGGNATFLRNEVQNAPFSFLRTGSISGPGLSGVTVSGNLNGFPIASFYLLEYTGLNENGLNAFRDVNGDGTVSAADRIVAGSPIPNFTYNFNGNVGYKNFDLSVNFNGVSGNKIYNNTANAYFNMPQLASGQNIARTSITANESNTNSATASTRFLESGNFLRLNNATLRYSFNTAKVSWLKNLSVFATGQNLLTFTNYTGFDPEVNVPASTDGITAYGIDITNYPRSRTYLLGLNIAF